MGPGDIRREARHRTSHRRRTPRLPAAALLLGLLLSGAHAELPPPLEPDLLGAGTILGTKHDFLGLNQRAGVVAMPGLAFSKLESSCAYCHLPPDRPAADSGGRGGIPGWNRFVPAVNGPTYQLYDSRTLDNKVRLS